MTMIKTSILSFIATAVKILAGLVISKAVAVYIGPIGLALVGQFQSFSQLALTIAQGGINTGVTKYTAEYGKDNKKIPTMFSTAGKISLFSSITVGLTIILFSNYASLYFLKSEDYGYIFIIFGVTIVLYVINNLLLSILNGLKEIKTYISINIIQSIYSLIFTTLLIVWFGLEGALIALVANQSVILLIVLWMLRKHPIINYNNFKGIFDKPAAKKLMGFTAMSLATAAMVPVSHLFIRNYIGETLSWVDAGYWQAVWYISTMYLMVVTTTLGIYLLPKMSELTDRTMLKNELLYVYKIAMPIVVVSGLSIFLLKDFIIWLLFTKEFTPMRELFMWQLIGDFFKLASFILGYYLLAKEKVAQYIFIQVFFSLVFVFFVFYLLKYFDLNGATIAYAITYFICFIYCVYVVKRDLNV